MSRKDIVGNKYNRLTVVAYSDTRGKIAYWLCECECGKQVTVSGSNLKGSLVKSCGCIRGVSRKGVPRTHGMKGTPTYYSWRSMLNRCNNKDNAAYGGRGVAVCEEWKKSFEQFFLDMGARPDGHSIDRIDPNLGYFKENCRWASRKTQDANKRNSRNLTIDGETMIVAEWARRSGVNHALILGRLRQGWDPKRAVFEKARKTKELSGVGGAKKSYTNMKSRCLNSNSSRYEKYGGSGISVCDRWIHSFETFLEDMGPRPEGMTLNRIDNRLGYSPENCEWADRKKQDRNKTTNRFIEIDGETKCVSDWASDLGIRPSLITRRINNGWTPKEAVFGKFA